MPGRAGHLLDWSANARALLVASAPLLIAWPWAARLGWILTDPSIQPYMARPSVGMMVTAIAAYTFSVFALTVAYLALRRRTPESPQFILAALTVLSLGLGGTSHMIGGLSSPMLGGIVAAANAITIFFAPRLAVQAMSILFLCYFGPLLLVMTGRLPYAPLYLELPLRANVAEPEWLVSLAALGIAILFLPLSIQMAVLARWRKKDELVHHLACFDALTGVANRRHFFELAEHEFARAARFGVGPGLVLVDVDHFKEVNDRFGHVVGDEALRHVAEVLASCARRKVDIVGRYGGEEFAILGPETDLDGVRVLAERCRETLETTPFEREGHEPLFLTASFGVATHRSEDDSIDAVVRRADEALYRAKHDGRNRVSVEDIATTV